jgi:hypothetical protein
MTRSIPLGVDTLAAAGQHFRGGPPLHRPAAGECRTGSGRFTSSDWTVAPDSPQTAILMINMHPMHRDGTLDCNAVPAGVTFAMRRATAPI